jgi:hypothetical protein
MSFASRHPRSSPILGTLAGGLGLFGPASLLTAFVADR